MDTLQLKKQLIDEISQMSDDNIKRIYQFAINLARKPQNDIQKENINKADAITPTVKKLAGSLKNLNLNYQEAIKKYLL
jgi:S-methylmethionine-dependent homocysteine/selenocysteine methylase